MPDGLDPAEAVSLVLSYVTAYQMLHRSAKVQRGQRILVHGAGGAVGTAMLQLGKELDLEMYGTASRAKHELVASLGATPIDYESEDFCERIQGLTGDGVDAAFDPIGGDNFKRSFKALGPGGVLVAYGFYNATMGRGGNIPLDFVRLQLWNILPNGRSTTFYSTGALCEKQPDWFSTDLTALFHLLAQGKIKPVIAERMGLAEAARAHELVEQAAVKGKVVLIVNEQVCKCASVQVADHDSRGQRKCCRAILYNGIIYMRPGITPYAHLVGCQPYRYEKKRISAKLQSKNKSREVARLSECSLVLTLPARYN